MNEHILILSFFKANYHISFANLFTINSQTVVLKFEELRN